MPPGTGRATGAVKDSRSDGRRWSPSRRNIMIYRGATHDRRERSASSLAGGAQQQKDRTGHGQWLERTRPLRLTKMHALLKRDGVESSYDTLRRYALEFTASRTHAVAPSTWHLRFGALCARHLRRTAVGRRGESATPTITSRSPTRSTHCEASMPSSRKQERRAPHACGSAPQKLSARPPPWKSRNSRVTKSARAKRRLTAPLLASTSPFCSLAPLP